MNTLLLQRTKLVALFLLFGGAMVIFGLLAVFASGQNTGLAQDGGNPAAITANAIGTLTATDPTFTRPGSCGIAATSTTHYDAIPFTVGVGGNVTLSFETSDGGSISPNGTAGTGPDTILVLYSGTFDPAAPQNNCLSFNDDINGTFNRRSRITANFMSPEALSGGL